MVQYCPMVILAWQANNVKSTSKRAVASAIVLMGSGLGGMVSGAAFKTSESPLYQVSHLQRRALLQTILILFWFRRVYIYLWVFTLSVWLLFALWRSTSGRLIKLRVRESVVSKIWTIGTTHCDRLWRVIHVSVCRKVRHHRGRTAYCILQIWNSP